MVRAALGDFRPALVTLWEEALSVRIGSSRAFLPLRSQPKGTRYRACLKKLLRDDFDAALKQQDAAAKGFVETICDVPSGLPHPDGVQRIKNVSDALAAAHDETIEAMTKLRDFENRRIIPGDLKG
jgi:hypothetical protein